MLANMTKHYSPRQMIDALIAIPTVSRDPNLLLIEFVQTYLQDHGVESHLVKNTAGTKANLYATVGPEIAGGVVLSGHTDVVPIDDQEWSTDPFTATESDGKLFGRGTCDMKSFIAIALALVPEMADLKRPIHFALSYDEEIGCLGAPDLIARMCSELPQPMAVIIGEPTRMRVVNAHKSILHFETLVTGHEAHSSQQHRGVSAVMVAAKMLHWMGERQLRNAACADSDSPFDPPYTTIHCGVIHGGTAANIMARHCRFVTDIRSVPGEDALDYFKELEHFALEELVPAMQEVQPGTGIEFDIHAHVPAFHSCDDEPAVALVRQLTGQNSLESVTYGAEAGQFQQAGFSVAMCGPGSIDQAHQPNEFITLEQVEKGIQFTRRLIDYLSA